MDTFFARNRLSAYLDGNLSDSEAAEVEAALAEDDALRGEYDDMRRAVELLRTVGPTEAPAGFHARVMAQVEAEPAPGTVVSLWRRTLGRVPVEALALAAAAVIVVLVIQGRGEEAAAPPADAPPPVEELASDLRTLPPPPPVQAQAPAVQQEPAPQALPASADGDLRTAAKEEAAASGRAVSKDAASSLGSKGGGGGYLEEPYYTGWEQKGPAAGATSGDDLLNTGGAEMSAGIDMIGPRAYRISLADPEVLYQLSALAEKAGGRLTDTSGNGMRARDLTSQDAWVRVHVVVPRGAASAVEGQVMALGGVPTPPPSDSVLYASDYAVFIVDVAAQP